MQIFFALCEQTAENILCKDVLDDPATISKGRFKVHYALDYPPSGWKRETSFIELTAQQNRRCRRPSSCRSLAIEADLKSSLTREYCGDEKHIPVMYPNSTNWGFCSKECTYWDPRSRHVYGSRDTKCETRMNIVPSRMCQRLGSNRRKVCARHQDGGKTRRIDAYILLSRKNKTFQRVPMDKRYLDVRNGIFLISILLI